MCFITVLIPQTWLPSELVYYLDVLKHVGMVANLSQLHDSVHQCLCTAFPLQQWEYEKFCEVHWIDWNNKKQPATLLQFSVLQFLKFFLKIFSSLSKYTSWGRQKSNTSVFILKSENIEKTFLKDTRVLPAVFYSFNLSWALHLFISGFFIWIVT